MHLYQLFAVKFVPLLLFSLNDSDHLSMSISIWQVQTSVNINKRNIVNQRFLFG